MNVITIHLPPLRERKEDIPLLVHHFIQKYAKKNGIPPKRVPKEIMDLFLSYTWPGNVRELENAIERALILSPGDEITWDSLPPALLGARKQEEVQIPPPVLTLEELERRYILRVLEETQWDKVKTAEILGINLSTVYRKLARYGIRVESEHAKIDLQNAKTGDTGS